MSLRMGKLYDALMMANGVDPAVAREAAEEVAGYDSRLAAIDARLAVLTWMVGTNVVMTSALIWMAFSIMGRLP